MPRLSLTALSLPPSTWPPNAVFGIDFLAGHAMRNGVYIPCDQALSLSRSSSRLAKTASGAWQTFAANEPAITDLGLSLESEASNLVVNNTGNSGAGILLTGTTITPFGGSDSPARDPHGKRVTQGVGASDGLTRHSINTVGGQSYSWSQSFKYDGSATWVRFTFSDNVAHGVNAWLNLQTMTLGTTGVFGEAILEASTLTPEIGGWHRLTMTGSVPNNAVGGVLTFCCASNGGSARVAGSYGIYAPQTEFGPASSPILTSGSIGTRSADSASLLLSAGSQALILDTGSALTTATVEGGPQALGPGRIVSAWTTLG